ncbi:MAG: carboxy terminal-processing peptidase, partial [Planctomycetaceae bacterium]|nr:carboxy terminal-processing peptidase [Planctomycetaceae bacterium]
GDATPAPQPASPRPTMRPERPVATPTPPPRRSYSPRTLNDASLTDNDATSTVRLIAQMVERFHITRPKLDDQVSRKVFDAYLRDLDPERLFFLESDMTQLSAFRTTLDDELKAGQTTFPYRAYGILSVRIREACDEADWLIDQPLESLLPATPERSTSGWAQTSDQRTDRWRRLLYSQLATCIGDEDLNAKRKQLHDRYQFLVSTMLLRDKLYVFESYLTAFVRTFDPHAAYVSSRSQQAIDTANELRSSLAAPGLLVTETEGRAYANLLSPHGLSQEEALLMDGAQIVGIGEASGQSRGTASIRETTGLPRERIQQLLTGKPGSFVAIEVVPSTESARRVVTMKRDYHLVSDDKVRGTTIDTRSRLGRSGKIGVLRIPSFYGAPRDSRGKPTNTGGAAGDVARILDQFERDVIEAVVIDLRRSGGGDVNQAVEVGGLFLPGGPVVQRSEPATGSVSILEDLTTDAKCRAPVIVLCDRFTRGEAEVLASSLSDHRRAIIVGDSHTFGMGTEPMQMSVAPTQMFRGLSGTDRGNLRLATSRYYRPSGDAFQQRGVTADVVLPSLLDQFDVGEKALADSLPFDRINPASFRATNYVTAQVVSDLKIKSAARIENNSGFADTRGLIQSWNTRNEQSGPPFAVRTTLERDPSLPSDEFTRQIGAAGDTLLPASYYHDEVLSIALDYVALLGG